MSCAKKFGLSVQRCSSTKCQTCPQSYHFGVRPRSDPCAKLDTLGDTDVSDAQNGDYLCYIDGMWIPAPLSGEGVTGIQGVTGPQGPPGGGAGGDLGDLGDVNLNLTMNSNGEYLSYNGTNWVNAGPINQGWQAKFTGNVLTTVNTNNGPNATGVNSMAGGPNASSIGESSIAIGNNAVSNGTNSIAIGSATRTSPNGIAIGSSAMATYNGSIALGNNIQTTQNNGFFVRHNSNPTGSLAAFVGDQLVQLTASNSSLFQPLQIAVYNAQSPNVDSTNPLYIGSSSSPTGIIDPNDQDIARIFPITTMTLNGGSFVGQKLVIYAEYTLGGATLTINGKFRKFSTSGTTMTGISMPTSSGMVASNIHLVWEGALDRWLTISSSGNITYN